MQLKKTDCRCDVAGWCKTHRRSMSVVRWTECHDKPGFYEVFQAAKKSRGFGDTVARWIKWFTGGKVKPCTGCNRRKDWLNKKLPYPDEEQFEPVEPLDK